VVLKPSKAKAAKPKPRPSRYTPPTPKKAPSSQLWVPVTMFTMMGTGVVVVIANYLQLLFGEASNNFLIVGLLLITGGFVLSTQLR
jgi:hypothetical protein